MERAADVYPPEFGVPRSPAADWQAPCNLQPHAPSLQPHAPHPCTQPAPLSPSSLHPYTPPACTPIPLQPATLCISGGSEQLAAWHGTIRRQPLLAGPLPTTPYHPFPPPSPCMRMHGLRRTRLQALVHTVADLRTHGCRPTTTLWPPPTLLGRAIRAPSPSARGDNQRDLFTSAGPQRTPTRGRPKVALWRPSLSPLASPLAPSHATNSSTHNPALPPHWARIGHCTATLPTVLPLPVPKACASPVV